MTQHFKNPIVGLIKMKIVLGTNLLKLIWRENQWYKINLVIPKLLGATNKLWLLKKVRELSDQHYFNCKSYLSPRGGT
jgi:hypothetical protein